MSKVIAWFIPATTSLAPAVQQQKITRTQPLGVQTQQFAMGKTATLVLRPGQRRAPSDKTGEIIDTPVNR